MKKFIIIRIAFLIFQIVFCIVSFFILRQMQGFSATWTMLYIGTNLAVGASFILQKRIEKMLEKQYTILPVVLIFLFVDFIILLSGLNLIHL